MTKDEMERESGYQISMVYAKILLNTCVITIKEYERFEELMEEKYHPVYGEIVSSLR